MSGVLAVAALADYTAADWFPAVRLDHPRRQLTRRPRECFAAVIFIASSSGMSSNSLGFPPPAEPEVVAPPTPSAVLTSADALPIIAAIDVGTSSVRLAIGEVGQGGRIRLLETLSQGVSLGKDTFTRGEIAIDTIEACVQVLRTYQAKLREYGELRSDRIRVVATNAVREASNRLALIDRVFAATGLTVEILEEAEVHRITYRSLQPLLVSEPELRNSRLVLVEVGGGSTEVLRVDSGNVAYSHSFRLGSLRLRQTFRNLRASQARLRDVMEQEIQRTLEDLVDEIPSDAPLTLLAQGGDARFAAQELVPDWDPSTLTRVPLAPFSELTEKVLALGEDAVARQYKLPLPEAETLGPALLVYRHLAEMLRLDELLVSSANLRDGLLRETVEPDIWTTDFRGQIVRSAIELGHKYHFDEAHALHVAELSRQLFSSMQAEHSLDSRYELILYVAALLHEIGRYVGASSLHKHSLYLIQNSELFGLSRSDVLLVGLVARYHRRASPKATHAGFANLSREQRVAVSKLAAILRVAKALDATRSQRIQTIRGRRKGRRWLITTGDADDLSIEQLAINQCRTAFEQIFGMQVILRTDRA
ncbi:MAG: HD domain-containing protein [Planctomycetaceae bacterium]